MFGDSRPLTADPSTGTRRATPAPNRNTERQPIDLEQPGTFTLGCNYWASHAGTRMWRDWQPDVIDKDLAALAAAGLRTLRVFPLWNDFQPIMAARGADGIIREWLLSTPDGEVFLPDTLEGRAGVDLIMFDRFSQFCTLAGGHGIELIVGLITGWMSGRIFCPPILEGRSLHSDPLALLLQSRFISAFVERFRSEPAISAWDLGNECNELGPALPAEAAWTWTAFVTQAIRGADNTRPVVSGMHSLLASPELCGGWTIQDQAEHTDILTTHPYPMWSRHAGQDPIDTIRTTLHATAESRMYADIGGKPCFAGEVGTMGPLMGDAQAVSRFIRCNLFSLWANDCRGLLWWCAFDQRRLPFAPYDWTAVERELGLLDEDRHAKPFLAEISRFAALLPALPRPLPPRDIDAICILTRGQDSWAAAYSSWVLATQAGLTLKFAWADAALPDSPVFFVPSISGIEPISRRRWHDLLDRASAGATIHLTMDDGIVEPFTEVFGVTVRSRSQRSVPTAFTLTSGERLTAVDGPDIILAADPGTTVLAVTDAGSPMVVSRPFGRGRVTLTAMPVEAQLTATPGGFHGPSAEPWHALYRLLTDDIVRRVDSSSPGLAVTVHDGRYAVLVNHGNEPAEVQFAQGCRPGRWLHGSPIIGGHDAAVVELIGNP